VVVAEEYIFVCVNYIIRIHTEGLFGDRGLVAVHPYPTHSNLVEAGLLSRWTCCHRCGWYWPRRRDYALYILLYYLRALAWRSDGFGDFGCTIGVVQRHCFQQVVDRVS
jgi:hypothetical protein